MYKNRSHDWTKKAPKPCEVTAFISKAEWINETAPKWRKWHKFWGKHLLLIGSEMQYVFDFSWNIAVIIVQSGLKLYDFTILAAGVEPNKFLISSHNGAIAGLFSNWRQNLNLHRQFLCSPEKRLLLGVVRNVRIHHLSKLNTKHKEQESDCFRTVRLFPDSISYAY